MRAQWFPGAVAVAAILATVFMVRESAAATSSPYAASMSLAVDHWLKVQEPSGFMPYAFDFLRDAAPEQEALSAVGLARQAGTAAVLADYYALTGDPRAPAAIRQLLRAFDKHSLPIGKSRMQMLIEETRVLSMPLGRYKIHAALDRFGLLYQTTGTGKVLSPNRDYSDAYTGTAALALLAELRYSQASGDNSFADLRRAWLEGLFGLRIPGDGFRQVPTSIDATAYFDGEAWLALTEYRRAFPQDQRISKLLTDVDVALMNKYGGKYDVQFFHWGTMTAAARFTDTNDRRFLDFLKAQTATFLDRKGKFDNGSNRCASVEGVADVLGALLSASEGRGELFERSKEWATAEMQKVKRLQIQPGQTELMFANSRIIAPRMQEFAGSFRGGLYAANTQVDFTAHCLSAMVKLTRHDIALPIN